MRANPYGRHVMAPKATEAPIFIFAAGERCGSTLIQRYLSSHADIFIWGEQKGALNHLSRFYSTATEHTLSNMHTSSAYLTSGVQEFIANLSPSLPAVKNSVRAAIQMLYGGFGARWGSKEIRCGAEVASMIVDLFPQAKIVFMVRNVNACVSSILRWGYRDDQISEVVDRWVTIVDSFCEHSDLIRTSTLILKYEQFIDCPADQTSRLCNFLGIDASDLDDSVLKIRVADHASIEPIEEPKPRDPVSIPKNLLKQLNTDRIINSLVKMGYDSAEKDIPYN